MQVHPGTQIGPYRVERLLGSGGMADVWLVRHETLGSRYALKIPQRVRAEVRERFLLEGRAQVQMRHPGLLPVHEILAVGEQPALLMPFIDGPSLDLLLPQYRPTPDEAVALFAAMLAGLAAAHRLGFVHRDLKPGNILLELRPGRVQPRIADFGLVKEAGSTSTLTGAVFGTPAYAAPEQLVDSSQTTAAADIFSMGVIFAELLNGRRPYAGTGLVQIYESHKLPPDLGDLTGPHRRLIEAMLHTDPTRRLPSCEAALEQLGATPEAALSTGRALWEAVEGLRRSRQSVPDLDVAGMYSALQPTPSAPSPHNLRRERDPFIGRKKDVARVQQFLRAGRRLVTVTGFGGVGKSRLVREAAWGLLNEEWTGGVWFVSLAEARTLEAVLAAVAGAMEVKLGADPGPQLASVIRSRGRLLLVLDNFEQIVDLAEDTVGRWLDAAPELSVLVTSREPLWIRGEQLHPLAPLPEDEAIDLFTTRAQAVSRRFSPDTTDREELAALVKLLDGLPLAIELAAARVRLFNPEQLRSRLQGRMDLLSTRSRAIPERQRTLRATLQWSWDLLQPWEQAALAQAAVFEGGFTVEAMAAVAEIPEAEEQGLWIEDILSELLDKSLLWTTGDGRIHMLVSIQQFALEHLTEREAIEQRHGAWFAEWGTWEALDDLDHHGGPEQLVQMHRELENLCAAAERAVARADGPVAAGTTRAAGAILRLHGPLPRYRDMLDAALGLSGPWQPMLRAELGDIRRRLGEPGPGIALVEQALAEAADLRTRFLALVHRIPMRNLEPAVMRRHADEAVAIARQLQNRALEGFALEFLAEVMFEHNEHDAAIIVAEESLAICQAVGFRSCEGEALSTLGYLHSTRGRYIEAMRYFQQALTCYREVGFQSGIIRVEIELQRQEWSQGNREGALRRCEQIYTQARAFGDRAAETEALISWTIFSAQSGALEKAAELSEKAIAAAETIGAAVYVSIAVSWAARVQGDLGNTDKARQMYHRSIALAREGGRADNITGSLRTFGRYLIRIGDTAAAVRVYEEAAALAQQHSIRDDHISALCQLARLIEAPDRAHARLAEAEALVAHGDVLPPQTAELLRETRDALAARD